MGAEHPVQHGPCDADIRLGGCPPSELWGGEIFSNPHHKRDSITEHMLYEVPTYALEQPNGFLAYRSRHDWRQTRKYGCARALHSGQTPWPKPGVLNAPIKRRIRWPLGQQQEIGSWQTLLTAPSLNVVFKRVDLQLAISVQLFFDLGSMKIRPASLACSLRPAN
jgi:hypothetical protein